MVSASLIFASFALTGQPEAPAVRLFNQKAGGGSFQVIIADLTRPDIKAHIVMAQGFPGTDEPFTGMVKRTPGILAAINGAYFDKQTKKPIGDIWAKGALLSLGLMGTAFCVAPNGVMDISRVVRHKGQDWTKYETVLACGPALVLDGQVDCDWRSEGFRDPHVTGSTKRMGLGYRQDGKLLIVRGQTSQTFEEFAESMKQLGCWEAMNLDAGASRGFYHQGSFLEKPGRRLTNILAIVKAG